MMKLIKVKKLELIVLIILFFYFNAENVLAQDINASLININLVTGESESVQASSTVQILFMFTLIALAPSILLMLTSFTRIIIALHFLRSALGTQQMPPNQVLIGLALFLTFYIMGPIFMEINETALAPYTAGEITQLEAIEIGMEPLRQFMLENVRLQDLALFADLAGETYNYPEEIPNRVLIPAFILTELTIGFMFGFFIFMPFIVIDMVVASVLMAMGMMMLPPAMISLPFKVLLFITVDGWGFVVEILVRTFVF